MDAEIIDFIFEAYITIVLTRVIIEWALKSQKHKGRFPRGEDVLKILNPLTEPLFKPVRGLVSPSKHTDFIVPVIVIIGLVILRYSIVGAMNGI